MTKKIRLIDDSSSEEIQVTEATAPVSDISTDLATKQLMKYLEAIDWKLWEILKIMKKKEEEDN